MGKKSLINLSHKDGTIKSVLLFQYGLFATTAFQILPAWSAALLSCVAVSLTKSHKLNIFKTKPKFNDQDSLRNIRNRVDHFSEKAGIEKPLNIIFDEKIDENAAVAKQDGLHIKRYITVRYSEKSFDSVLAHEVSHFATGDVETGLSSQFCRNMASAFLILGSIKSLAMHYYGQTTNNSLMYIAFYTNFVLQPIANNYLGQLFENRANVNAARLTNDPLHEILYLHGTGCRFGVRTPWHKRIFQTHLKDERPLLNIVDNFNLMVRYIPEEPDRPAEYVVSDPATDAYIVLEA